MTGSDTGSAGGIKLKREIGILQGVSIIVGVIVGSGIFVSPVGVLQNTGSVGLAFIMWLVTGIFSMVGAIVYAELGVTIPRSGGEYIYILTAFGSLPAFLCLWITFVVIGAASTAANSMIFAEYILQPFFKGCGVPDLPVSLLAVLSVATLIAVNCYNVTWATKTAIIFTFSKVLATIIVIIIGLVYLCKGNTESFEAPMADSYYSPGMLAMSFYQGFWAYAGWNYLNFLTEEMKNPARNLPIAIIISLTLVIVIYLLANVAYLAVLSPKTMLMSSAVAVNFADETMGVMAWVMPVFVGCSVFGSMNGEILSMSRLPFTGAREGHMPSLLAMVSYKYLTPMPSILVMFILVFAFQMYSQLQYLIELAGFAFCVIAAMAVGVVLYLRYKQPDLPRPFKLPIAVHVLFLFVDIFIMLLAIYQKPHDFIFSIIIMGAGIPVYWFGVSWKKKPKSIQNAIETTTIRLQKLLQVVMMEDAPAEEADDNGNDDEEEEDNKKKKKKKKSKKNSHKSPALKQNGSSEGFENTQ